MFLKRTPSSFAVVALVVLAACGADDSRLAELEAENEQLRQQLAADVSTTTSTVATGATTHPSTTSSESTTTRVVPSASTTSAPSALPEVVVLSVTDGDTLRVAVDGVSEPVRLIGINAPEDDECLAAEAAQRLAELVDTGPIRLESDVSDRDQYERLLRYVYAGDLFVNEQLVAEGLALARRYEPDTALAEVLEAAQARALEAGVGMWAPNACGTPAAADIVIGEIRYDADGDDNFNLNDEWVELINHGGTSLDLTGWSVKDESASHRYRFPDGFTLDSGASVRLHTGCGNDSASALYWCNQGSAVWNNSGDTVFVLDPSGNVAVSQSW